MLFVGINDVNWRGTTEEEFESGLRRFAAQVRAANANFVLATPFLLGERPEGSNRIDPAIDRFAAIVRRVAGEEDAVLVDLRQHALDWLQNHNRRLHLDGRLTFEDQGLLTYDGIHPSDQGNELLADWIAAGILAAR